MQHWNDNGRVSLKVTYFPAFGALRDVLWNVLLRFSIARGGALEHFLHIALNFGRRIIPQIKDVIIILDKSKVLYNCSWGAYNLIVIFQYILVVRRHAPGPFGKRVLESKV